MNDSTNTTTTTVQSLVDTAMDVAQDPTAPSAGKRSGIIGHTANGDAITATACYDSYEMRGRRVGRIEAIEYAPGADVIIGRIFDDYGDLEDLMSEVEDSEAWQDDDVTFDDLIQDSGVAHSCPDTRAKWKGGEKEEDRRFYWIEDMDALARYIADRFDVDAYYGDEGKDSVSKDSVSKDPVWAIFAPEPNAQDAYGRPVRGMLMHVVRAKTAEQAFEDFDQEVGATDTTADDYFIDEVPETWLDSDLGGYDYPDDEIL
jgi:hypothetical protein